MDIVNYNDFKNICRICLFFCEHRFLQNTVISKMYYMLMGIHFETNDQLPQQICLKCYQKMVETDAFESQCKQSHSSLIKCLENYKNEVINVDSQVKNEFPGLEDITIQEHKIEFIKTEENDFNDELQIKSENTEEISEEMITDQNVNLFQNDLNEYVEIEDMSKCNTWQNDLSDDINSDNTSIKDVSNEVSDLRPKAKRKYGRPIECEICNKTFNRSNHLKRHKLIHSGERPHVCEICNKSYNRLEHLNRHKLIHSSERSYVCEICSKSYNRSDHLNKHKLIHSVERSFECKICNKSFNQSNALNTHKLIHTKLSS